MQKEIRVGIETEQGHILEVYLQTLHAPEAAAVVGGLAAGGLAVAGAATAVVTLAAVASSSSPKWRRLRCGPGTATRAVGTSSCSI